MRRFRVLVAEDEAEVRKYLVRELRAEGLTVDEAQDGSEAVTVFESHLHPVVLLDLRMPKLDGIEVLKRIKERRPETEVVIITGHGGREDAIQGLNHHAFRFLEKPPDLKQISRTIQEAYQTHLDGLGVDTDGVILGGEPSLDEAREAMARIPEDRLDEELGTES